MAIFHSSTNTIRLRRRPLRRLGSQLHHQEYQGVEHSSPQYNQPRIPPAVVLFVQVECLQVVLSSSVSAHLAVLRSAWVQKVRATSHSLLIGGEIVATCLVRRRIEDRKLAPFASDIDGEGGEGEEGAEEVVEGIEVVEPKM